MLHACVDLGLGAFAANHEFGRAQYEINLRHSPALDAADRAFRFKDAVKEMAARDGLLATFIGKPWNDDEGSGFHLHLSLADDARQQRPGRPTARTGSPRWRMHFIAGLLEHAPGADGVLQPDDERLPADPRGGAGADAGLLGP